MGIDRALKKAGLRHKQRGKRNMPLDTCVSKYVHMADVQKEDRINFRLGLVGFPVSHSFSTASVDG